MSEGLDPSTGLSVPTAAAVLRGIGNASTSSVEISAQRRFQRKFLTISTESAKEYEHLRGIREHYKHKGYWSGFLMLSMFTMIAFQSVVIGMVGGGVWNFEKYTWLLPALLIQNFAQIVGLALFVVKALFKDIGGSSIEPDPEQK